MHSHSAMRNITAAGRGADLRTDRFTAQIIFDNMNSSASELQVGDCVRISAAVASDETAENIYQWQQEIDFFEQSSNAIIVAKFSDRYPNPGVCTMQLRSRNGQVKPFNPAHLEAIKPKSEEHLVLRYGTEEAFQKLVGWDPERCVTVEEWMESEIGQRWLDGEPTKDRGTDSTDLHYLCSNPSLTVGMMKAIHHRRGRKRQDGSLNLPLHDLRDFAELTPLHNLCGNLGITYALCKYVLQKVVCPCTIGCTHSCCAQAAVNAHALVDKEDAAASRDASSEIDGSSELPRGLATALHIYTKGLPMSTDVLDLLLNAAGGPDGDARTACAIPDLGYEASAELGTSLLINKIGLRPLHYCTLWPFVRINPRCIDRIFVACKAVAGVPCESLEKKEKWRSKTSTPLHIMCGTLAAMMYDCKTGTAKRTVYIDHVPLRLATEEALREEFATRTYIRNVDHDIEWIRVRTRANGSTMAIVRFTGEGFAEALKADERFGLAVQDFFTNLHEIRDGGMEDQIFVEDLSAEQDLLDKYKFSLKLATSMLHQLRGQWSMQDCKALYKGGVLTEIESWLRDMWHEGPSFMPAGRIVAVNDEHNWKGIVEKTYSQAAVTDADGVVVVPERTFVTIRRGFNKYGKLEDIETTRMPEQREVNVCEGDSCESPPTFGLLAEGAGKRWCAKCAVEHPGAVNLSFKDRLRPKNVLLVCRLLEFLCQSNNPFEVLFNLMDYFADGFLLTESTSGAASRKHYKKNMLMLEMIATQLADNVTLRSNVEDKRHLGHRLSAMLLQPMMVPTVVGRALRKWPSSGNISSLWQFAGGFATRENDRTVKGPLWIATQHHCIQFTSQPWVQSYIDHCMDQNLDHKLSPTDLESLEGSVTDMVARFAKKPIYFADHVDRTAGDGWSLVLIQHMARAVLGQQGKIGPRAVIDFFHSGLCIILNPIEAIEFPRLRHYSNIICYIVFTACFLRLQHVEGGLALDSYGENASPLRKSTTQAEYDQVNSSLLFFRVYVWAQCLGMVLSAARLTSRYNIHFVLKDIFTVLDCFIAVFIVVGEVLLMGFRDGGSQRAGYVILCLTNLAIGVRYLDFLRSFEQIAPLVRVLGQMIKLCFSFMLMLFTILLAFAFAIYGLHSDADFHDAYPCKRRYFL